MSNDRSDKKIGAAGGYDRRRIPLHTGAIVNYQGNPIQIKDVIDTQTIVAVALETGKRVVARIKDLQPIEADLAVHASQDIELIDDDKWLEAKKRYEAIKPLLDGDKGSRAEVSARAKEVGVHPATLYRWLNRYKSMELLTTLVPIKRGWVEGRTRLDPKIEKIIESVIQGYYLRAERPNTEKAVREVHRLCEEQNLPPPGGMTVRARIDKIPEYERLRMRGRKEKARNKFEPVPGKFTGADYPLAVVQIDHTPVDVIVVDERYRLPLRRPWLTVATDVYSRMIVGYYISLDSPSLASVALCVAQAILPKDEWLLLHEVEAEWPVWGVPKTIHVDNGADFRSSGLKKACDLYGIDLVHRPVKQPRFGGNVERVQGTILRELHDLPGTTFSSVAEKEDYDSEKNAALTIKELEKQILRFICNEYHRRAHKSILMPPLRKWEQGIHGSQFNKGVGLQPIYSDRLRVFLDFLPAFYRTVQADGVTIDGLQYYDECLRPWIGTKNPTTDKAREHLFKRDPRVADVIWFHDPDLNEYFKVPLTDQSLPSFSIWEYQAVKDEIKKSGYNSSDRSTIMRSMATRREEADESVRVTKKVNRERARRDLHAKAVNPADPLKKGKSSDFVPDATDLLTPPTIEQGPVDSLDLSDIWDDVE